MRRGSTNWRRWGEGAKPEPNGKTKFPQRRGDAETSAEKTKESQDPREQRKRRNAGRWREGWAGGYQVTLNWRRWGEGAKPEPNGKTNSRRDAETQRQAQRRPRQVKTRERGGSGGTRAGGGARGGREIGRA